MINYDSNLPVEYVLEKFFLHAGKPKRIGEKYNASCPICREGNSWLKKKRLYYYPTTNSMFCHNCQNSWSALWWIKEVTNMSPSQIFNEAKSNYGFDVEPNGKYFKKVNTQEIKIKEIPDIPRDSINLFDTQAIDFYKSNTIVQKALKYIHQRKLDTAINKPKAFYLSLKDMIHKNRIIIPFFDENGKRVDFYQARKLLDDDDKPKYLSKMNADKTIFNICNIKADIPYIFVFEGPIDACFVHNGVAMAGINYTSKQAIQLNSLREFYKIIWVLDNPAQDQNDEVKDKIIELIDRGETIFIWPKSMMQYKDINDYCVDKNVNEFPYQEILNNTKSGIEAKLALA